MKSKADLPEWWREGARVLVRSRRNHIAEGYIVRGGRILSVSRAGIATIRFADHVLPPRRSRFKLSPSGFFAVSLDTETGVSAFPADSENLERFKPQMRAFASAAAKNRAFDRAIKKREAEEARRTDLRERLCDAVSKLGDSPEALAFLIEHKEALLREIKDRI